MKDFIFKTVDFHVFTESLSRTIEKKDIYTAGHSNRVAEMVYIFARAHGLPDQDIFYLHIASHLHDIGKIGVPDGILLKTGRLTDCEYRVIQQHSVMGWEILKDIPSLEAMASIIRHHHERYDGKGYPDGLASYSIPLGSRLIAVADALDAMTTTRTYRQSMPLDMAIAEIKKNRNTQFDGEVVDTLESLYKKDKSCLLKIFSDEALVPSKKMIYTPFNSLIIDRL